MWDKIKEIISMKRKITLTALILAAMMFFLGFQVQSETKKISLVGQVVNGTFDNKPVADLEVELHIYKGNKEITGAAQKTETDHNGYFSFSELDSELDIIYSTLSIYEGVEYYGPVLENLSEKPVEDYKIVVYESTSVDPGIFESMHHYIISSQDNLLNINEIILLKNGSKNSFIGDIPLDEDKRRVIYFNLPEDLTNIALGDGLMECCVVFAEGTLTNTMALPPGTKQISFSYRIPLKSSEYLFHKILDYDVEIMNVFLASQGASFQSAVLESKGPFVVQDEKYYRYAVRNLKKGEHFEFRLSNLSYLKNYTPLFFAVGIILGLAIGLGYWRYKYRRRERVPELPKKKRNKLATEKEKVLKEIEQITADLEEKKISKEQYNQKYQQLKSNLINLYKNLDRIPKQNSLKKNDQG